MACCLWLSCRAFDSLDLLAFYFLWLTWRDAWGFASWWAPPCSPLAKEPMTMKKGCLTRLSLRIAEPQATSTTQLLTKRSSNAHLRFGRHPSSFPASLHDTVGVVWDWRTAFRRQAAGPVSSHVTSCLPQTLGWSSRTVRLCLSQRKR